MKSLLISLLIFVFAQAAQADPVELDEVQSKKLYNVLAAYGLRMPFPADRQTREWAIPVNCEKIINGSVSYTCQVHDEYHHVDVQRTGSIAKKLYDFIYAVNGQYCSSDTCLTTSLEVTCVYWWPNKDNPPPRPYRCVIDRTENPK